MTMIAPEVLPPQFLEGSQSNLIQIDDDDAPPQQSPPIPWWRRRTKKERRLLLLLWACTLISGVLLLTLALTMTPPTVCLTPECVRVAHDLLANLDLRVDPCENFYEFACGGFIKSVSIPDDQGQVSTFGSVRDKLAEQIRVILEEKGTKKVEEEGPRYFKLAQNLYQSCMDVEKIEKIGLTPLKKSFDKIGGWPVLLNDGNSSDSSWDPTKFTWMDAVAIFHQAGFSTSVLLEVDVHADKKNSTQRKIHLRRPTFGLSPTFLLRPMNDTILRAYAKYQIELAVLFGSNQTKAETEMGAALEFERQLALIALPTAKRNESKSYNLMTIRDLTSKYPSIPWLKFINAIISPRQPQIQVDEPVIVEDPIFLSKFEQLINQSEKRTLANYFVWRVAKSAVPYLTQAVRSIHFEYAKVLSGVVKPGPRWRECVDVVSTTLPVAVGSYYVRRFYEPATSQSVNDLVKNIRTAFLNNLNRLDWMDEETREKAKNKLIAMSSYVGHPSQFMDQALMDWYHGETEMTAYEYHKNILGWNKFFAEHSFQALRAKVNRKAWFRHVHVAIVNAFYTSLENSIQIPAGILQGLFFHRDRPNYINYGAIGSVIGHEMTHGFDDVGSQYDGNGNLAEWWEPATKKKYLEKAQCIINQYGNYSVRQLNGLKISGSQTQGENIADNGGLKEAYRAYVHWTEVNGDEPKLPGLNYTTRQLFWISAANLWCGKFRPGALKQQILTDVHSPGEFRVRGPMSNSEEFARDFNCSKGSGMNPIEKCSVW